MLLLFEFVLDLGAKTVCVSCESYVDISIVKNIILIKLTKTKLTLKMQSTVSVSKVIPLSSIKFVCN